MDISSGEQEKSYMIRLGLQKRNLKRESQSFLIAAQNNTVRTNYDKVKIDTTHQNRKCR